MHYITDTQLLVGLAGGIMVAFACFGLGFQAGDKFTMRLVKALRGQLNRSRRQHDLLQKWIRENWPNEYAAYAKGHSDGYKRGWEHADQEEVDETAA